MAPRWDEEPYVSNCPLAVTSEGEMGKTWKTELLNRRSSSDHGAFAYYRSVPVDVDHGATTVRRSMSHSVGEVAEFRHLKISGVAKPFEKNHQMKSMATEELYLYGGMDIYATKSVLSRKDIVLESVIKSGHFANIYRAKYKGNTVVAKTLKANGTELLHIFYTPGTSTFFDMLGLDPEIEYTL
ncbi:hypothetical protein DPMN_059492 [Dreissena polymorpha]|uniref:Uncharacterized protein n=1 Tax=Dreissena polymorpha TaxID=45954 RepID=A0A9D4HGP8_DREPO|nr:hypothetical protein DPMN_059492 [Dreissena polymorpha]